MVLYNIKGETRVELKFRNAKNLSIFIASFLSGVVMLLALIGIVLATVFRQASDNLKALKILGIIIVGIWVIYLIVTIFFSKTVIVTEREIVLKKRNKCIWKLSREEILECEYNPLTINSFYQPNAGEMFFTLKETGCYAGRKLKWGLSVENHISLSRKNVERMREMGYNIKISE